MRTVALAALALVLIPSLPPQARADHLVVGRETAIRGEPRRDSPRLATAERGTRLDLLSGEIENGYYKIHDPASSTEGWIYKTFVRRMADDPRSPAPPARTSSASVDCSAKKPMRVRFYDVGQALAALVSLPDGRNILVDAGESPTRAGCGTVCRTKHEHLLERLEQDLQGAPIAVLWATHQHSDHIGGAAGVLETFRVGAYVDNGQALGKSLVRKARAAATFRGAKVVAIDLAQPRSPVEGSGQALRLRPVVPSSWTADCEEDPNSCSLGLRIDYCSSSVLFTGDAEADEEQAVETYGNVTLLQVGHHGSDTSSSSGFIAKVSPKYAVISAGARGEGLNSTYCHPREATVELLTKALGGPGKTSITAFDGSVSCKTASDSHWHQVRASDHLWETSRDGDVVLSTTGDGLFVRE